MLTEQTDRIKNLDELVAKLRKLCPDRKQQALAAEEFKENTKHRAVNRQAKEKWLIGIDATTEGG